MAKKFNCALYRLNFFRNFSNLQLPKRLIEQLKRKIPILQNKCIRYLSGLRRDDHVTPVRRQLGWLTTDMWRMYVSAVIMYKARRIGQPTFLAELFNTRRRIDLCRGDAIRELELPSWSSEPGKKLLAYECAKFWNELPNRIHDIPSWEGSNLLFIIIYSIPIPNSSLSCCHYIHLNF